MLLRNIRIILPVLIFLIAAFLYFTQIVSLNGSLRNITCIISDSSNIDVSSPRFAVVTQTAQCLPSHLLQYFGNPVTCDCHVYVLSYRAPCTASTKPSHVTYMFNSSVGWSGGRNIAYTKAWRHAHNYLYYILMDDDVQLQYNRYTPNELRKTPPFEIFTDFLSRYMPAGAAAEQGNIHSVINDWHLKCGRYYVPPVFAVGHVDQMFVALHRNTVDTVLPYVERFDSLSYWISAMFFTFRFEFAFYGQMLYFPHVHVENPLHRYKERGHLTDKDARRRIIEDLNERAPPRYKNHSILNVVMEYNFDSHLSCSDPPEPNSPIIPYARMHNFTNDL